MEVEGYSEEEEEVEGERGEENTRGTATEEDDLVLGIEKLKVRKWLTHFLSHH